MTAQAVLGLKDRGGRKLVVDPPNPLVGSTIVAYAVHLERPVHAVHHATGRAAGAPQTVEIEVERIEQAGAGGAPNQVLVDTQAAPHERVSQRKEALK